MSVAGTVCLMYHEIELPGRSLCDSDPGYARYAVRIESFTQQLRFLKDSRRSGINVSQMLANSGRGVVLTFDDGCETDLITAMPLLQKYEFQATFYITVGFLGKPGFMTREQARGLGDAGLEIGCHSMTHPYLTDLDDSGIRLEVADAKSELEDIVGRSVKHFSCPGGRCDQRVVTVAKQAGYESVATSQVGVNAPGADPFSLSRIAVTHDLSLADFSQICSGEGLWAKQLRNRSLGMAKRLIGNSAYNRLRSTLLGTGQ
jgi:peptidoglycan/xylan/chitin deacetylase (PgdA/CDA1 family)